MCSFGASDSSSSKQESSYGTHTPVTGDQWNEAYKALSGAVDNTGANAAQSTATDWLTKTLKTSPNLGNLQNTNYVLGESAAQIHDINKNVLEPLAGSGAKYQLGTAPTSSAATSANAPMVNAASGASMSDPYASLYSRELIDPALAAHDYGTDRAFSALDARTAGAGAFGNTRSGLGYSDLGSQSALNRGQLEAGLRTTGLTNALGFGQTDANRALAADTTNAGNTLNNNQFNAGLQTQNNQYNSGLLDSRDKFNVNANYQGDQQQMQAASQIAANLGQRAGLSQQILQNVVTQNGIDMSAAQALFASGAITQAQLQQITQAAQQTNGYEFTQNTSGTTEGSTTSFGF